MDSDATTSDRLTSEATTSTTGAAPDTPVRTRDALVIGALGGLVGALLGGGTGTVTVPALDRLSTLRRVVIHGTATIANCAVAAVGVVVYLTRGGPIDLRVGIPLMVGGVFGVVVGARLVVRAPERVLRDVFIAVLIIAGGKLLVDALGLDPLGGGGVLPADIRASTTSVTLIGLALGVATGAWSAALGLGGSLLVVPSMVLLFGASLHAAEGTSLAVMLPNSVLGAATHLRQGTASMPVGARLALGAAVGAVAGALAALALPARVLGIVVGGFVLAMAGRELRRARRRSA